MKLPQLISDKEPEILAIFADHGDFVLKFPLSDSVDDHPKTADIELLVSLDGEIDEVVVLIFRSSQVLRQIRPTERHDFAVDVLSRLSTLLNCSVNVVDQGGFETNYPITAVSRKNEHNTSL